MSTFNIYCRSYNRFKIMTGNLVEYCTYVVRESQKEEYEKIWGNVMAVPDHLIDGGAKVLNYMIENAEEDVICVLDDDLKGFKYRLDKFEKILDKETATREIERLAQLCYDLDIGYANVAGWTNLLYYDEPFRFCRVNGGVKIFNRKKVKGRFDQSIRFLYDDDFQLQELMYNRICLIANYFVNDSYVDTNKGGNNDDKTRAEWLWNHEELNRRWGKYYKMPQGGGGGSLRVIR